jgi:hypothetical protein
MATVEWNKIPDRTFQYGVDRGVLYVEGSPGVPWNGLLRVDEKTEGAQLRPVFMEGRLIDQVSYPGNFSGAISAITYPDEFELCDGYAVSADGLMLSHQPRKKFSLTYRTKVANPLTQELANRIHLIFGARIAPTDRSNASVGTNVNPLAFSWPVSAVPAIFTDRRPTAHVIVDSRLVDPSAFSMLEDILYGTDTTNPRFPTPAEITSLMKLRGLVFALGSSGTSAIIKLGQPAELVGDPLVGVYRTTENSPLVAVPGRPDIYRLEL